MYTLCSGLTGVCILVEMVSDCEAGVTTCLWGGGMEDWLSRREGEEEAAWSLCADVGRAKAGGVEHMGNVGRRTK